MRTATSTGWAPSPWFLVTPPQHQAGVIERPRITRKIGESVAAHRVTVVAAPAGFGKTVALSEWWRDSGASVAWLSLTRFDAENANLLRGVVTSLQRLAQTSDDPCHRPLLALQPDTQEVAASYRAVIAAVERVATPIVLVLDDAHLAATSLSQGVVGTLIEQAPQSLRIVLTSREALDLPLARARLAGVAGTVTAADLCFTDDEVLAAAKLLDSPTTTAEAHRICAETGGWPAAVRLALVTNAHGGASGHPAPPASPGEGPLLTDYIADEILARLRPDLVDFILAATTTARSGGRIAQALSGRADSAALLEECVRLGLFLDRYTEADSEPVYRWHAVFSEHCRRILYRTDPDRADRLSRVAAEYVASRFPLDAVVLALRGHAPELAVRMIRSHWLPLVIEANAAALDKLCATLPAPWATDPEILLVRACCVDMMDDRSGARRLYDRACAAIESGTGADAAVAERLSFLRALVELFIEDDHDLLSGTCDRLDELLSTTGGLDPSTYACSLFLLGWTCLRLRRDPPHAMGLLHSAVRECRVAGLERVAQRAAANLAFAFAYGGEFDQARQAIGLGGSDPTDAEWIVYDGGIATFTTGFVDYWQNDLEGAERAMRRVADGVEGDRPYASLALVYLAFLAGISGDQTQRDEAEAALAPISDVDAHGMPWPTYKRLAQAKLAEANGRIDRAVALARQIDGGRFIPVTAALLAEVYRRAGEIEAARELIGAQDAAAIPSYARVGLLVTTALIEHGEGDAAAAHATLEQALDLAVVHSIARPLSEDNADLRALLTEHATWGTKHEEFLAACLAGMDGSHSPVPDHAALSPREREILDYMRTTMTTADIAAALFVSVNTVRTHQRAVYRKLGVSGRREAIRIKI